MGASKAVLEAVRINKGFSGRYAYVDILLRNVSDTPAYPVTIDLTDDEKRFFLDDNFFMLKPDEEKTVRITVDKGTVGEIQIGHWNGACFTV